METVLPSTVTLDSLGWSVRETQISMQMLVKIGGLSRFGPFLEWFIERTEILTHADSAVGPFGRAA